MSSFQDHGPLHFVRAGRTIYHFDSDKDQGKLVTFETPFFKLQFWLALLNSCVHRQSAVRGWSEEETRKWIQQKRVCSSKGHQGHSWIGSVAEDRDSFWNMYQRLRFVASSVQPVFPGLSSACAVAFLEVVRTTRSHCPRSTSSSGQMAGGSRWNRLSAEQQKVGSFRVRWKMSLCEKTVVGEVAPAGHQATVVPIRVSLDDVRTFTRRDQCAAEVLVITRPTRCKGGATSALRCVHLRRNMTRSSRKWCTSYHGSDCFATAERANGPFGQVDGFLPKVPLQCVRSQRPAKCSSQEN